jgi:hypothetical protein
MKAGISCLLVLFALASGSVLAQEPFLVDTTIVYSPAPGRVPSVAFDGENYLVMWGKGPYGTRVSPSMDILDYPSIMLSPNPLQSGITYHSVAYGTDELYLVVWERNTHVNQQPDEIYFARVSASGKIIDDPGVRIRVSGITRRPFAAFANTTWLVAWYEYVSGNWVLVAKRVTLDGQVLDYTPLQISTENTKYPCVAFDGENWLVVWSHGNGGIYGARVSTSGQVLDPVAIQISNTGEMPCLAFDGTNYLVVWENGNIYGARVAPDGTVLSPESIPICTAGGNQEEPYVCYADTSYLVVWEDERSGGSTEADIFGARVDTTGAVLDPSGFSISTATSYQRDPCVAFDGTNWFVNWEDPRGGELCVYGARVSQDGDVIDPDALPISLKINNQDASSVVYDGTNYFAIWQDWRSGDYDIYGARLDEFGQILDSPPIPICHDSGRQWMSAVAPGDTSHLAVWSDDRDVRIYGKRVSFAGTVLDSPSIQIGTGGGYRICPAVAYDGENWLCVWQDGRHGITNYDIYGTRVTASGEVLEPGGIPISTAASFEQHPSVGFGNGLYFVAWDDNRAGPYCYGARVTTDGVVLDPSGIHLGYTPMTSAFPSVASDGTNFLVVFQASPPDDWGMSDIHGTIVDTAGTVLTTLIVSSGHDIEMKAAVARYDGSDFIVMWQDDRNDDSNIRGAKVSSEGVVVDSFEVVSVSGSQTLPDLAWSGDDQFLLTFSGPASEPYSTTRIWGSYYPEGGVQGNGYPQLVAQGTETLFAVPNPFKEATEIAFRPGQSFSSAGAERAGAAEDARLMICDASGRVVRQFLGSVNKQLPIYRVIWDGTDENGNRVRSGVYFGRLSIGNCCSTAKLLRVR